MSQEEPFEFDDNEAIAFILNSLSPETRARITDDDVQYVLDLLCEYYDQNNLFEDEDGSDEAAIAEDDMHNFIWRTICKEKVVNFGEDDLQEILDGNLPTA